LDVKGILGGGREVSLGEFPWAVGLMEAESGKLICGGSILTETFILTAGRCVHRWLENGTVGQVSPSFISVIAGDNIRGQGEGTEQIIAVERIIVHPGFQL
jgi:secreted trypsin-like serine protease